ncbi:hypothetical protein HQ590_04595 [bacterium]|nr:hypothetical protein [bacterium]
MSIRFGCESCGRHLEAEPGMVGQRIACPHCGHRETVPATPTIGPHQSPEPADVEFSCDTCGQSLVVAAAATGLTVNCPKCRKPLIVPGQSGERPVPPNQSSPLRVHAPPPGPPPTGSKEAIRGWAASEANAGSGPAAPTSGRRSLAGRHRLLRAFSVLYQCLAVLVVLAAAVLTVHAVLETRWEGVLIFVAGLGLALVLATAGRLIDLAIDLELNSRASCILLEDILRELKTRRS